MLVKMEVGIISKEMIKPSLPSLDHLKPFKLSLFDQLTPVSYNPLVFFFSPTTDANQLSTRLKKSLSETLSLFYPLSGRVKNNLFIECYDQGIPYIENRVNSQMFDFLRCPQTELLNQFLPCQPFSYESEPESAAQAAVQLNIFDCGNVAIGMCSSHKVMDGVTASAIIRTWAAVSRGSYNNLIHPELSEASLQFRPRDLTPKCISMVESIWFNSNKLKTKRFMFDAKAIAILRAKAKSEQVDNPTRVDALTAFLWRSFMKASREISGSLRPSISEKAMNIRRKMKPRMSHYSMGNLVLEVPTAPYYPCEKEIGLDKLVGLLREADVKINSDYLNRLQGDEGFRLVYEDLEKREDIISKKNIDVFTFSSWLKLFPNEVDFGWGKLIWCGISGPVGQTYTNHTFFKESACNNGLEAWVTIDDSLMTVLEHDPEFLMFASPNPGIFTPSHCLV